MRKYLISHAVLLLLINFVATGQDSIVRRIIFIGDAGEMNKAQQSIIPDAASRIIPGKTTVMYLGNNIYSKGMGPAGTASEEYSQQVLRSQYQPMRNKGAAVYFIPGNYDWDGSGKNGLVKIKKQWEFLHGQNDPLLQLVSRQWLS